MDKRIPRATHEGKLKIGDRVLPCAVLENGTRAFTQEGMLKALGRAGKAKGGQGASDDGLPSVLRPANLGPFISEELRQATKPTIFRGLRGQKSFGYRAELLPLICKVYIDASAAGVLHERQTRIAEVARVLWEAFAHVGVTALIDEATGYQSIRKRDELNRILEAYISKELLPWSKTLPDSYYEHLFRLRGLPYDPASAKRPSFIGKDTNDIVYDRLPPGVLDELRRLNPTNEKGRRRHKHFQFLTEDIGHPTLRNHLIGVVAIMRASTDWSRFKRLLERAYHKPRSQQSIDWPEVPEGAD